MGAPAFVRGVGGLRGRAAGGWARLDVAEVSSGHAGRNGGGGVCSSGGEVGRGSKHVGGRAWGAGSSRCLLAARAQLCGSCLRLAGARCVCEGATLERRCVPGRRRHWAQLGWAWRACLRSFPAGFGGHNM